jgi:hypothetical protein
MTDASASPEKVLVSLAGGTIPVGDVAQSEEVLAM